MVVRPPPPRLVLSSSLPMRELMKLFLFPLSPLLSLLLSTWDADTMAAAQAVILGREVTFR